ncbi:hypothetical protein CPC08DRAFT_713769 [Agrocybe pediades]|nr:hypothetical protein CPC08DRAFT_713769 [Agrocybe pediades]
MRSKIVQDLVNYLREHTDVRDAFKEAFEQASSFGIIRKFNIQTLDDYLKFYDDMLLWTPREDFTATQVYHHFLSLLLILDLPPILNHQIPTWTSEGHTWLSDWLVEYAKELGTLWTPRNLSAQKRSRLSTKFQHTTWKIIPFLLGDGGHSTSSSRVRSILMFTQSQHQATITTLSAPPTATTAVHSLSTKAERSSSKASHGRFPISSKASIMAKHSPRGNSRIPS